MKITHRYIGSRIVELINEPHVRVANGVHSGLIAVSKNGIAYSLGDGDHDEIKHSELVAAYSYNTHPEKDIEAQEASESKEDEAPKAVMPYINPYYALSNIGLELKMVKSRPQIHYSNGKGPLEERFPRIRFDGDFITFTGNWILGPSELITVHKLHSMYKDGSLHVSR